MRKRIEIGIWTEWPGDAGWTNEGMTRLLGFMTEGLSRDRRFAFRVIVSRAIYQEARADLNTLAAVEGIDYHVHTPENDQCEPNDPFDVEGCLKVANGIGSIEAWIVLYPYFSNAVRLRKPVAAILPDSIPTEFPTFGHQAWIDGGAHHVWATRVRELLAGAQRVVTFSEHVARDQANKIFDVPLDKITVVPHAPPDLAHLLPFVSDREATPDSRAQAAEMLRAHARARGWTYLSDFTFEETPYFVVSTQDRPTKNIAAVAKAVREIVRERHAGAKVLTTAGIVPGSTWTLFPEIVSGDRLEVDIISAPHLPRAEHAALYHCAALAIHPSNFEGGQGPFPFYEAVSVGTPCLMAMGPHVAELLKSAPELAPWTFEPDDPGQLASLILATLADREAAIITQRKAYLRLNQRGWDQVAADYCQAALGRKVPPAPPLKAMPGSKPRKPWYRRAKSWLAKKAGLSGRKAA
jgi:glycosyltransferase involved in cell wall biosynthesis